MQGMEVIHGPMGYNDLDAEGLLIEGYVDQMSTFEGSNTIIHIRRTNEKYGFI
jgi:hypothetical protein